MNLFGRMTGATVSDGAPPGRSDPLPVPETHAVSGNALLPPYPAGMEMAMFGMGCFWGAEKQFWKTPGIWVTAVGYSGGDTPNPSYQEVCSGRTGHNEVVRVVYELERISYDELLRVFWESHDPTQGMRQGNDVGTQYRSGIYVYGQDQMKSAEASRNAYAASLKRAGFGAVTTEILEATEFYFAEAYHQQYLAKNSAGYCGLGGTGVTCPVAAAGSAAQG